MILPGGSCLGENVWLQAHHHILVYPFGCLRPGLHFLFTFAHFVPFCPFFFRFVSPFYFIFFASDCRAERFAGREQDGGGLHPVEPYIISSINTVCVSFFFFFGVGS